MRRSRCLWCRCRAVLVMVGDGDTVSFGVGVLVGVSVVVGDGDGASRRSVVDGLGDGVGSTVGTLIGVLVGAGEGAVRWLLGGGVYTGVGVGAVSRSLESPAAGNKVERGMIAGNSGAPGPTAGVVGWLPAMLPGAGR